MPYFRLYQNIIIEEEFIILVMTTNAQEHNVVDEFMCSSPERLFGDVLTGETEGVREEE